MIKFTTQSGAVYLFDEIAKRLQRVSGDGEVNIENEEWFDVSNHTPVVVGHEAYFDLVVGRFRYTSPVVSIEEVNA